MKKKTDAVVHRRVHRLQKLLGKLTHLLRQSPTPGSLLDSKLSLFQVLPHVSYQNPSTSDATAMNRYQDFDYDVIVVGSGAGGGMAAYELTRQGQRVLMLEAGRDYDPYTETPMFQTPAQAPLRGTSTPDKNFGFYDATVDGGWQVPGEPYTTGEGSEFLWWRSRMLGGRTNHWGRFSLRFSHHDFKGYSRDGLGADWPIDYDDLSPWYDRTEAVVGVCGDNPGIDDIPDTPDGVLQPPPAPRVPELLIQAAGRKLGIPVVPMHRAVLTRPLDDRQACFYATACGRGCSIGAAFQTTTSLLPMARATGNLHIVTDAMVKSVETDAEQRATGVMFVDRTTGADVTLDARVVVLAASACETARILLNSKSERFPMGLANSSGQVGRNLMDSTGVSFCHPYPRPRGQAPIQRRRQHLEPPVYPLVGTRSSGTRRTRFRSRLSLRVRRWFPLPGYAPGSLCRRLWSGDERARQTSLREHARICSSRRDATQQTLLHGYR